jgi:hypothetical protein
MPARLPSVRIIIPWFGPWPAWMRFFVESCRWNPTVDWLLVSDAKPPKDLPPNVRTVTTPFEDYRALIASRLGINPAWTDVYKICDIRPAMGLVHHAEIAEYDYWGYGDLDVIYGDIRHFYTPDVLVHDVISPHKHVVAGHFVLLRNTSRLITAFQQIPRWKAHLSSARHKSFDEQIFSRLFLPIRGKRAWRRLVTPYLGGGYFREQFSTSIPRRPLEWIDGSWNFPRRWFWDRGHLTTDRSGEREFLYVHLSHWQSNRWTGEALTPWKDLARLDNVTDEHPTGFVISANGFTSLPGLTSAGSEPPDGARTTAIVSVTGGPR